MKIGIHRNLDFGAYREIKALNQSVLKIVRDKSPFHAKLELDYPSESTPAQKVGNMVHTMVLEPEKFGDQFAIYEGTRRGKKWDEFKEANSDKEIFIKSEIDQIQKITDGIRHNDKALNLIESAGDKELTLVWEDVDTGVLCKGRIDIYNQALSLVLDLKTSKNADKISFSRDLVKYGYDMQAAFYLDGLNHLTGESVEHYGFIVVENCSPYQVAFYQLDAATIELGREKYKELLFQWAHCEKSKSFPSYSNKFEIITAPTWAFNNQSNLEEAA